MQTAILKNVPKTHSHICSMCSFSPQYILNESNKKRCIEKFLKIRPPRVNSAVPTRTAGVLIPICHVDDSLSLLFTLRSADLKSHGAQVSFPGGIQDKDEKNASETALRETFEELGIPQNTVQIWCEGNPLNTRLRTTVTPVIGYIETPIVLNSLVVNKAEVAEVFSVKLKDLCDPKNIRFTQFRSGYSTPVFLNDKHRIWGLTAIITHFLLLSLIPNQKYISNIKFIPPFSINKEKISKK